MRASLNQAQSRRRVNLARGELVAEVTMFTIFMLAVVALILLGLALALMSFWSQTAYWPPAQPNRVVRPSLYP